MQCLMLNNYFSCIYIYICEIWIRTHVAIVWKHAQKWLLQFRLTSEKLLFRASELYLEWFTPDPLWNNELNLGAIVSVLYLTRNCKSTKLKGSQIKFLKKSCSTLPTDSMVFCIVFCVTCSSSPCFQGIHPDEWHSRWMSCRLTCHVGWASWQWQIARALD